VPYAPTAPGERLLELDVLRGLALFGVLLENLQHFAVPSYTAYAAGPHATALDLIALDAIRLLCDNKVYAIFAFLFGYGIALQMQRISSGFVGIHIWRMAVLFLIGVAHGMVWEGDILSTYALLGLLLIPLRKRSDGVLIAVGVGGFIAPALVSLGLLQWGDSLELAARDALSESIAVHTYPLRQTSFAFGAFALGLAGGRAGLLSNAARFTARTRRAFWPAAALGILCSGAAIPLLRSPGQGSLSGWGVGIEALLAVGTPALAFAYLYLAMRACTRPAWRPWLAPIADVGRTTLTNYLLQSTIGIGILARTGLGPLGPLTPPLGCAVAVLIFAGQVVVSRWWLSRFRFGPVEWFWRAVTYASLPPMRVEKPDA